MYFIYLKRRWLNIRITSCCQILYIYVNAKLFICNTLNKYCLNQAEQNRVGRWGIFSLLFYSIFFFFFAPTLNVLITLSTEDSCRIYPKARFTVYTSKTSSNVEHIVWKWKSDVCWNGNLKLYCRYLYTRPCMINHIWGLKQLWLQVNGHAWFHLQRLRWPIRNGEGAKNSKWKYMSPAGFEPTPRQSTTGKLQRLRPLGHAG